jgi:hypothetical protein
MKIAPDETRSIRELITMMRGTGFFPYAIFAAVIAGFLFADNVYRSPYLVALGYPLAYIGMVMG